MSNALASLFKYKQWADAELLQAIGRMDETAQANNWHAAVRVMNHIRVVDEIFIGHLGGTAHGHSATNTVDTPSIAELSQLLQKTGQWYVNLCESLPFPMLSEVLPFTFTDGDAGRMSREEILLHVIAHGTYHRGAAGRVLVQSGLAAPRDLFTRFLHATEPSRRG